MAPYRYRAISSNGSVVSGITDAFDQTAALRQVREFGHFPVSASLASSDTFFRFAKVLASKNDRVSHRALAVATQELATLLEAGLDLERALAVLERLADVGVLQAIFADVRGRIRDGESFADSLAAENGCFPKFFISMVRAGEYGGTLQQTLRRLSEYLTRSMAVRQAIASALLYPVILLATAGLSIVFILVFVLPEFRPLFAEAGRKLPWPTRLVMMAGDFLRGYWWLIAGAFGVVGLGLARALRQESQRKWLDAKLLRVPVLGSLIRSIEVEKFSRTLGTLLSNGVHLAGALSLAADVIGNRVLAEAVAESATGLREGEAFAERLESAGVFPPVTIDLIRVGEESGQLDQMLLRQADLDEQRVRHSVDRLLAILVPALTIVLGLMVGGLIASLLTAILSVNDLALPQ